MALEKRYQVFVSSTYEDLKEERQQVIRSLLELRCFPCSMEFFPADNDVVWEAIKKLIEKCDYYLVIVAGRYGSVDEKGISYTRKEYEYAVEVGVPVMAFLHKNPNAIPSGKTDGDPGSRAKLEEFKQLCKRRVCADWESPADLGAKVTTSLVTMMDQRPAVGWVRGDAVPDESAAQTINCLRTELDGAKKKLEDLGKSAPSDTAGYAQGDDTFELHWNNCGSGQFNKTFPFIQFVTWNRLLDVLGLQLLKGTIVLDMTLALQHFIEEQHPGNAEVLISEDDLEAILLQFLALRLIVKRTNRWGSRWTLTPFGVRRLTELRAIPRRVAP